MDTPTEEYFEKAPFDLERMYFLFTELADVEGETNHKLFLDGLQEITKLFRAAFSFATSDVTTKIRQIKERIKEYKEVGYLTPEEKNFTLEELIQCDISHELHHRGDKGWNGKGKSYHAIARTVLRLLWFLDFVYELISRIERYKNVELSTICREAYTDALAPHHPWSAMVFCPRLEVFMKTIQGDHDKEYLDNVWKATTKNVFKTKERLWNYMKTNECERLP